MANAFDEALHEAGNYSDPDAFASDLYLSSVWIDKRIAQPPISWLRQVWVAANKPFSDILRESGMSRQEFSEYFHIPYRTLQNWFLGVNTCPLYVRLMMQELLGQFSRAYTPDPEPLALME